VVDWTGSHFIHINSDLIEDINYLDATFTAYDMDSQDPSALSKNLGDDSFLVGFKNGDVKKYRFGQSPVAYQTISSS